MTIAAPVNDSRTLLLSEKQVIQRINRLAYQVYEDNSSEKEIIIAGILKSGYQLAEKLAEVLRKISPLQVIMTEVAVDKHSQVNTEISISLKKEHLQGKVIILVDDVLNSGKTLMFALKPFLAADIKKIRTVVLVDRNHKRFPVSADFYGLSLSTTLQEHVTVEFGESGTRVWLS
jgi:pyrimidine operon attenuation protein / uracil phosphoribosyltransferase